MENRITQYVLFATVRGILSSRAVTYLSYNKQIGTQSARLT